MTTFCVIYLFLPACLNIKTTFQTVENNLPDRASIFCQSFCQSLTFLRLTESTLLSSGERVKCQCRVPCSFGRVVEFNDHVNVELRASHVKKMPFRNLSALQVETRQDDPYRHTRVAR